ncbi:MAG: SpoIIE family protein phosphatase [Chloroflexota bacterium]
MFLGQFFVDGLSWPSISFAVLVAALLVSTYVLGRRLRSRRLLVQRVRELEALSTAGRALVASELDMYALCGLIAQEASKVIDNRTFQVGLFEDHFYHIIYWTIDGLEQPTPHTFDLSQRGGIVGWLRTSKQPLLVHDLLKEADRLPARPRYISKIPPRSAILVPLISGERTIGIVVAQSLEPNRFNEEDLRRLMILSNQAAAAIANAQLYQEARRRAAHLELVGQIARQVNAASDLDDIFEQVVTLTRQTFGFHPVTIFGLELQTSAAVIKASSEPALTQSSLRLAPGQGLVGTAVVTHTTIISPNTAEDERFVAHIEDVENSTTHQTRSEIAIPLLVNGEVLGVLDVQSSQINAFSRAEQTALETLAAEVASAIHKAQQLSYQRERSWITTAQLQVAEAINRSNGLDEIVTAVVRLTPMLTGVSFCAILLWQEEEEQQYQGAAFFDGDHDISDRFSQIRLKIGDWPALDAVHVGQEILTTRRIPPWLAQLVPATAQMAQMTIVPISTRSQIVGAVLVSEYGAPAQNQLVHPNVDYRHEELLQNIADQTAQAIESAQLRLAQQEEAWVNTALLQVAEAVNNLIDLNEILDTIVRLVPMLVGVQSAIILIWDEARDVFVPGPSHGVSEMGRGLLQTLEVDRDEFVALAQQSSRVLAPASTYYAMQLPHWLEMVLGRPQANAFPLNARGQMVGMMVVALADNNSRSLSPRRLNILNGIAHQAATAVVNNHLYREAAERQRLEQELNVAREIQASLIPQQAPDIPGCSVSAYWQAARQVSGDFYDFLALPDGRWGIVIADVADKGVPAALFMALSRTILRTVAFSGSDPARVLMRVNELIDNDAQTDLFVTMFYAIWEPATGQLVYANGGHNPPLLLSSNGEYRELHGNGMALGVLPQIQVDPLTVSLHITDTVIFYTDGVTEAINEDYDEFGLERMLIAATAAQKGSAYDVIKSITQDVIHHAGETPQFDDITLVVLRRDR